METLLAQPSVDESKVDLNQMVNKVINHLTESISKKILLGVQSILENHQPKQIVEKTEYLTQQETCNRLKISRSTLFQREKKGLIKRDGFNGRPLYSVKHIEEYLKTTDSSIETYDFDNI